MLRGGPTLALAPLALFVFACSSSSPAASTSTDAGYDASEDSAPPPYVPITPVDGDSGGPTAPITTMDSGSGFDAGTLTGTCATLEANVTSAAIAAAACNPLETNQCTGTTPGLCCSVTVSFDVDPSLTDDLNAAIAAFHSGGCTIDCTKSPCPPAPSRECSGMGNTGTCQ